MSVAAKINSNFRSTYTAEQCKEKFQNLVRENKLMRAYVRGERNGKLSKSGEKYFDEFIDDFWKKPETSLVQTPPAPPPLHRIPTTTTTTAILTTPPPPHTAATAHSHHHHHIVLHYDQYYNHPSSSRPAFSFFITTRYPSSSRSRPQYSPYPPPSSPS
ncbi:hypothetical protein GLOIN_2v1874283 [Rhizophagus clarus]|uniref:Uncharacterized protein n=1 Tax=Rhizophagus clarus TaxID=94130 RepID=A0A8H3R079_9GLOM|nr:hypothetical protein GLOIN_2v1874283 [Rhizophagus clarus]